ncbi:alpha-(1,3)-fucosyltransferase B [Chrysoperla carnea]|uniref:alpha-(1,3)-fucosyltransferase B n=1 Tax=Chrysoperla carnea TaxID=189513 RepID=UPI001D079CC4|nr:alpha-(1,3)-fucosyltransferase B [Chrysoperla carnea]
MLDNVPIHINCECMLTNNRKFVEKAKAIIFYGSQFDIYDLPLPRNGTIWVLINDESPKNNPLLLFNETLNLFNISSTFSRYSNFPTTLQYFSSIDSLLDTKHFKSIKEKNALQKKGIAPIMYLQSTCSTPILRDEYVKQLMEYVQIDSYGDCLNNKRLPESLREDYLNNFYGSEILEFMSEYKFVIAIENAECEDYITEKLWKPLVAGAVPIYKGASTVRDWLPNSKSTILIDDFDNIKDLAKFILKMNSNDTLYNEFLKHKTEHIISNTYLIQTANKEKIAIECFICDILTNQHLYRNSLSVSTKHYNCSNPRNQHSNSWAWFWKHEKSAGSSI